MWATENTATVDQLLNEISSQEGQQQQEQQQQEDTKRGEIQGLVEQLAATSLSNDKEENDDSALFEDLIGYYNVSYTLTTKPNDNPVGGKWTRSQRLWKIQRTMQHVLPLNNNTNYSTTTNPSAVAQVVNAIYLECLWGLLPIWIVLRGDAVPISKDDNNEVQQEYSNKKRTELVPNLTRRTVRAYFDKPRIALGKFLISFGPTSSVVIDTPYVDERIRIGVGGTSGTKFVFARVTEDDQEAKEAWKWVLEQPSMITKTKVSWALVLASVLSGLGWKLLRGFGRWVSGASAAIGLVSLALVLSSTGGIETRGDTYTAGTSDGNSS
jgi:hypothetical protein